MNYPLRKGSLLLHVQIQHGMNLDLYGSNFEFEYSNESKSATFHIDLSGNLRKRNKQTNTYIDAKSLESSTDEIESIQINDGRMIKLIADHLKKLNVDEYSFNLSLLIETYHKFEIGLEKLGNSLFFRVS